MTLNLNTDKDVAVLEINIEMSVSANMFCWLLVNFKAKKNIRVHEIYIEI